MARKLAAFCEFMGVRTAWHGPGDVSPVGHAANMHLDLAVPNFGIQELSLFRDETREVFPGCPEVHDGCLWANDRPGLGIDIDEKLAAKYPVPRGRATTAPGPRSAAWMAPSFDPEPIERANERPALGAGLCLLRC